MKGEFNYANGLLISQARKFFKFFFADFFIKADKNDKEMRFDIYVFDKIEVIDEEDGGKRKTALLRDWCDVDYFCDFWNGKDGAGAPKKEGTFNVIIVKQEGK